MTTTTTTTCRVCGKETIPAYVGGRIMLRAHCSDECFYRAFPAERPASDIPPELPQLTWKQRREQAWQRIIPPRQRDYDYDKLKPNAQAAGKLYADYTGEFSILLTGASEACKTYVAYRLARKAYMSGKSVIQATADEIRARWLGEGGGDRYLNRVKSIDVLLIDDLGMEPLSDSWKSVVYEIINRREANGLATIVTVNRIKSFYAKTYSTGLANRLWNRMKEIAL